MSLTVQIGVLSAVLWMSLGCEGAEGPPGAQGEPGPSGNEAILSVVKERERRSRSVALRDGRVFLWEQSSPLTCVTARSHPFT